MTQLLNLFGLFLAFFATPTATEVGSTEYGPTSDEGGWTNYVPIEEPALVLASRAGEQAGVVVRYSVETDEGGYGSEMTPARPKKLTIARPGETVAILFLGTEPAERLVTVRALGCKDRVLGSAELEASVADWPVPTRPGAYEVEVTVPRFEAVEGGTGTATAVFGLLVDKTRPRAVIRASRALFVCAPPK